jgi:hypothetical protein
MRDLEDLRKVRARLIRKWSGVGPDNPMINVANAENAVHLSRILGLPVEPKSSSLLDASGRPLMVLGLMSLGVGHPLA